MSDGDTCAVAVGSTGWIVSVGLGRLVAEGSVVADGVGLAGMTEASGGKMVAEGSGVAVVAGTVNEGAVGVGVAVFGRLSPASR